MNRIIKKAVADRHHYENHDQLRVQLADFVATVEFARCLKTFSGLVPYEYIAQVWTSGPGRSIVNPLHQFRH